MAGSPNIIARCSDEMICSYFTQMFYGQEKTPVSFGYGESREQEKVLPREETPRHEEALELKK